MRELTLEDIGEVVRVHRAAFPASAITRFGSEAVRRYYVWLLDDSHEQVALGAFGDSGRLAGFCFGGIFKGAMSGYLARNRRYLALRGLTRPWLLASPLVRSRVATALRIVRRPPNAAAAMVKRWKIFGVLSIATDPELWGRGVGGQLLAAAEAIAREREFVQMNLTVSTTNERAISFYERRGWVRNENGGPWQGGMRKTL